MIVLMREAKDRGATLVVFPELALTTFFPQWFVKDEAELDRWFEAEMPSPATRPLFDAARALGVSYHLGYAEKTPEGRRFNIAIVVDPGGRIVAKHRKVHFPGHREHEPWRPFQHLEKRCFEKGDLGFPVVHALGRRIGLCVCNDRRWPETWRMLGLGGAELVMLG